MKKIDSNIKDIEKLLHESYESKGDEALKAKWAKDLKEIHGVEKSAPQKNNRVLIFSILGILLIAIASIFYFSNREVAPAKNKVDLIYASVEMVSNPEFEFRNETNQEDNISYQAYQELKSKNYNNAIEKYSFLLGQDNLGYKDKYYLGFCLMKTGRYEEAIKYLKEVSISNVMSQESEWLLAISYLKNGDKISAQKTLNKIVLNKQYMSSKAAELLK